MRTPTWPSLSALEHCAFVCAGLLVYVLVTRIGQQRRHSSAAMAWVLAIAAFRYLALPLFLAFGTRKVTRPQSIAVPSPPRTVVGAPDWATWLLAGLRPVGPRPHGGAMWPRAWCGRWGSSSDGTERSVACALPARARDQDHQRMAQMARMQPLIKTASNRTITGIQRRTAGSMTGSSIRAVCALARLSAAIN